MLIHYHYVTAFLGLVTAGVIFYLVRKDQLSLGYSIWWIFIACGLLLMGVFPGIVDTLGRLFAINYPPVFLVLVALCLVLLKMLQMDIDRSKLQKDIRILTQRLAVYEQQRPECRQEKGKPTFRASAPGPDQG